MTARDEHPSHVSLSATVQSHPNTAYAATWATVSEEGIT